MKTHLFPAFVMSFVSAVAFADSPANPRSHNLNTTRNGEGQSFWQNHQSYGRGGVGTATGRARGVRAGKGGPDLIPHYTPEEVKKFTDWKQSNPNVEKFLACQKDLPLTPGAGPFSLVLGEWTWGDANMILHDGIHFGIQVKNRSAKLSSDELAAIDQLYNQSIGLVGESHSGQRIGRQTGILKDVTLSSSLNRVAVYVPRLARIVFPATDRAKTLKSKVRSTAYQFEKKRKEAAKEQRWSLNSRGYFTPAENSSEALDYIQDLYQFGKGHVTEAKIESNISFAADKLMQNMEEDDPKDFMQSSIYSVPEDHFLSENHSKWGEIHFEVQTTNLAELIYLADTRYYSSGDFLLSLVGNRENTDLGYLSTYYSNIKHPSWHLMPGIYKVFFNSEFSGETVIVGRDYVWPRGLSNIDGCLDQISASKSSKMGTVKPRSGTGDVEFARHNARMGISGTIGDRSCGYNCFLGNPSLYFGDKHYGPTVVPRWKKRTKLDPDGY